MNSGAITEKLTAVSDLIRLPKQYGTALLLCPTLWALFLASGGVPSLKLLVIFITGAFLMRSAGCAINDIADRDFDRHVERTKSRPLADGRLKVREAAAVFILLTTLAFVLVLLTNRLTILLSVVGILLASTYPLIKRVSSFPQAFLGIAFGWGAVMAWAAVRGEVAAPGIIIFVANIFWSMAYDTVYALMDIEDDIKIGVKSTAIYFGEKVYTAVYSLYGGLYATLIVLGLYAELCVVYYVGVTATLLFFTYLIWRLERSGGERGVAMRTFVYNAAGGGVILLAIILDLKL